MLQAELRKVRTAFLSEHGDLALEVNDVSDWESRKILDNVSALPFLASKRMVIMQGLAANKAAADKIHEIIEAVSDATDLLIVEPKLDKRGVLYKTLKKEAEVKEFAEPDPRDLPKWLHTEARARGGDISVADAAYLVNRVGPIQQLLSGELDKLQLYQPVVTRGVIDLLTEQAPLSNIFDLIEAAFAGNFKRALDLYDDQRAQNVEPLAIEALFAWQLHAILLIKTAGNMQPDAVAADAGLSPYVARKSAGLASRRTLQELKTYIHDLAELEYTMKTMTADPDELMKNFILTLGQ